MLSAYRGRPLRLMEVCGTHTAALHRAGVRSMLPAHITMLSGPGCPVCVTPTAYIDKLAQYALTPGHCVLSFGDLLGVPGSAMSLAGARARGGHADFFYTPFQALDRAAREPDTMFILAAVGFETTAPVWAAVCTEILARGLHNVRLLTALKTMPVAMDALCSESGLDGFLCPGHVAVITGSEAFRPLAEKWHTTMVVGGFTPEQLLRALTRLIGCAARKQGGVWNEYPEYVRPQGNPKARAAIAQVFAPGDACWRGLGLLAQSGLYLTGVYAALDAGSAGLTDDDMPAGCQCGAVLRGLCAPAQCPLFGARCRPSQPVGACMVSGEGACRIAYEETGGKL